MSTGTNRRLLRLLGSSSTILLPLDGGLIDGPMGAMGQVTDLLTPELVQKIDCILGYVGLLKRLPPAAIDIPFIVNLSASTVLGQPTRKVKVGDVLQAVSCGADGVCFQLHITDQSESLMLEDASKLIAEAERFGMPVLLTVYPRKTVNGKVDDYSNMRRDQPAEYVKLLCHCVRVAAELGADVIKTAYPGNGQGVDAVVSSALGVPVLIAGGAPVAQELAIEKAAISVRHGARGIAFGRQLFMDQSPTEFVTKLRCQF